MFSLRVVVLLLPLVWLGCTHGKAGQKVETVPAGGWVTGEVASLERRGVLDNKDFVYAIALSPDATHAAFTHLAGKTFNLGIWSLAAGAAPGRVADIVLNEYAFDVEGLSFSPEGAALATAGRDGLIRFYSVKGQPLGQFQSEEPLVSVAFLPDGKHVVAGSARGLLTLVTFPDGRWVSDVRAHRDEVRGIAVTGGNHVVTGGWDKSVAVLEVVDAKVSVDVIRLAYAETPQKVPVVRGAFDGRAAVFAVDASKSHIVVSSELARAAGVQAALLTETVKVGIHEAKLVRGRSIQLKHLNLIEQDVAVCDACIPPGAHGVLGAPILSRFEATVDTASGELVLEAKEKQDPATLPTALTLKPSKQHTFEAYVNDVSIDRAGRRAGVAFSHQKAERTREVYEREKKGVAAPFSDQDAAAIVDLESGQAVRRWHKHQGVVATAGISPDGKSVASGGWDKKLYVFSEGQTLPAVKEDFGWSVRRARFSNDGRLLAVGAWTPQNALGDQESDPAAVVYDVGYRAPEVVAPPASPEAPAR